MAPLGQTPFRFGEIVEGDYFTDREAEVRSLGDDVRHGLNVVLISPCSATMKTTGQIDSRVNHTRAQVVASPVISL
jgi:hypothetical protein